MNLPGTVKRENVDHNFMKRTTLPILFAAVLCALAEDPSTNQPTTATPERPEAVIPELQSVKARTNPPPSVARIPEQPKAPAIVLRNVTIVYVKGQPVLIVPERYLADLTNIFKSVSIPKIVLDEP